MSANKLARLLGAVISLSALVQGCGSGAVSSSGTPTGELLVLPDRADVFPGTSTVFSISGGTAPYSVFTSNGSVVPVVESVSGSQFSITPNEVAVDTPVTLTVRDRVNATKAVTATVKVSTLSSTLTFTAVTQTPSSTCGAGNSMCGGGDALVQVRAVQNGVPLTNRAIRFDVVNGQFNFVTSAGGTVANSHTITTDATGLAVATVRASAAATSQAAVLRYTDTVSSQSRTFGFSITQTIDGASVLTVVPAAFGWLGADTTGCRAGGTTTHYIFGGAPPYTIQATVAAFATLSTSTVPVSGGGVNVTVTGNVCTPTATGNLFTVTDQNGRTATFSIANQVGTAAPPAAPVQAPLLIPNDVTLACGQSTQMSVIFTGSLGVSVSHPDLIEVTPSGSKIEIKRKSPSAPIIAANNTVSRVDLNVTDGTRSRTGSITLSPIGNCP